MARTAFTAPAHTVLQRNPGQFTGLGSVAPDAAPSLCYGGSGLQDHRMAYNKFNSLGNGALASIVGWNADSCICVLDATPAAASATNVVASAVATAAALTLVTSSGAGIIAMTAATVPTMFPFGTVPAAGSLAVGAIPTYLKLGLRDISAFYDPTTAQTAILRLTAQAGATATTCTHRGYDYYGQAMAETVTVSAGGTVDGKKAFKIITSSTLNAADATHTYSVGTQLATGLNIAADVAGYVDIWVSGTGYTTNPTIVAADATTATATTGDVRGTTILTAARTLVFVTPSAARLVTAATPLSTGLFGVTNFTS